MLEVDPKKRPSASKILKHKWIKKHAKAVDIKEVGSVSLSHLN